MQDIRKIKHYDLIQKMCLMDDELMGVCFAGHKECTELLIRIILGRDDLTVKSSQVQKTLKGLGRSVRLDIFAVDTKGKRYNIEFQRADKGASPERARFNAAMIDVTCLKPGQDFKELPEVYIIFITERDVLGYGLPLYNVEWVIGENGKPFNSRQHIVYVNCENQASDTPLGKLVHDFLCRESGDKYYYEVLGERISYIKEDQEGVKEVSSIVEAYAKSYAESYAEERAKEQQKTIVERMIEGGKLALQEIAEYSGLSLSAVKQLAKKLEESRA